jgi:NAD(P)-dependent dehydrogenase (short-subunit alcohol dehydrogenase family)
MWGQGDSPDPIAITYQGNTMNKVVLITGTSTGLGRRTALHFARHGWKVAATMRSPEKETELQRDSNIRLIKLDVTDTNSVHAAVNAALKEFEKIDVVINNAGIGMYGALELTDEAAIDQQYAVNVRGVINVIRATLPHFRENKGGMYINIGSVMGLSTALPLGSLYNMSKFALEGLTEGLYFELKPLNIHLRLVEPGGFGSAFGDNVTFSKSDVIRDYDTITSKVGSVLEQVKGGGGTDSQAIVDGIYALATRQSEAFRTVIGKDAKSVLFLRKVLPIKNFLNTLGKSFGV